MFGSERNHLILRRESSDLKSTFSIELRLVRNNLLGVTFSTVSHELLRAFFHCLRGVNESRYTVTDFEHGRLVCDFIIGHGSLIRFTHKNIGCIKVPDPTDISK